MFLWFFHVLPDTCSSFLAILGAERLGSDHLRRRKLSQNQTFLIQSKSLNGNENQSKESAFWVLSWNCMKGSCRCVCVYIYIYIIGYRWYDIVNTIQDSEGMVQQEGILFGASLLKPWCQASLEGQAADLPEPISGMRRTIQDIRITSIWIRVKNLSSWCWCIHSSFFVSHARRQ